MLETEAFLQLAYKNLDNKYELDKVKTLLSETMANRLRIHDYVNYALYQLLEDSLYIEIAYKKIQKKADNLEPDVAAKFLSYPIPKAIVEEWERVNI